MTPIGYAKPDLLTRIDLRRSAVIEASAGTGKTYTLEHLVVDLLLNGGAEGKGLELSQILVVTFTEKATAELRGRVARILRSLLALDESDEKSLEIRGNTWFDRKGKPVPAERVWVLDEPARRRLAAALSAFDAAPIFTIHGFCQRILGENAFESGRPLVQERVEGAEAFRRAAREALRSKWSVDPVLRPWFEAWVQAGEKIDVLIDAMRRAHELRSERFPKLDVSALIAAAAEVAKIDPEAIRAAAAPLQHSTRRSFLERFDRVAAVARRCAALAVHDIPSFLHDPEPIVPGVKASSTPIRKVLWELFNPDAKYAQVVDPHRIEIERFTRALVDPLPATVDALLPSVQDILKQRKRDAGQFDFDDLLLLLRDRLASPQGQAIGDTLRDRFKVALVDEFQDTDEVQWEIFRRAFHDAGVPLYVIGDPKQAIYAFRGADVRTYLAARDAIVGGGGGRHTLSDCYRSTPALIGAINTLLDDKAQHRLLDGAIRYDAPVIAGKPTLDLTGPDGQPLTPLVIWKLEEETRTDRARSALAHAIAEEAVRLLDPATGARLVDGASRPLRPRDLLVLVRKAADGTAIVRALRARGIPVSRRDTGLFASPQAADLLVLLRAIAQPGHPGLRGRALLTPWFGLSIEDLGCMTEADAERLTQPLREWHDLAGKGDFRELCVRLLSANRVVARALFDGSGERGLTNLQHLVELLLEESGRGVASLSDLAERLAGWIDGHANPDGEDDTLARLESERDAVRLLTMHAAKGLEAPVVFWAAGFGADVARDRVHRFHLPDGRAATWVGPLNDDAIKDDINVALDADERRLAYVALTRPIGRLYLPHVGTFVDDKDRTKRFVDTTRILDALDERLDGFLTQSTPTGLCETRPLALDVPNLRPTRPGAPLDDETRRILAAWTPPPELLAPPAADESFRELLSQQAARRVASYSSLKRSQPSSRRVSIALPDDSDRREQNKGDDNENESPAASDESKLKGGTETGNFLHKLLELADFEQFTRLSAADLPTDPAVWQLMHSVPAHAGYTQAQQREALRLVHTALTSPVRIGRENIVLGRVQRESRELEFHFPMPEGDRSWLTPGDDRPFEAHRGWVKGVIDFVFEHDGKVWFADWKSDTQLDAFDAASVAHHAGSTYGIQARLYLLVLAKLVGATDAASWSQRAGGMAYVYLRGLTPADPTAGTPADPTAGVASITPGWDELRRWEQELAAHGVDVSRAWMSPVSA